MNGKQCNDQDLSSWLAPQQEPRSRGRQLSRDATSREGAERGTRGGRGKRAERAERAERADADADADADAEPEPEPQPEPEPEPKPDDDAAAGHAARAGVPLGTHVPSGELLESAPDVVVIGCQEFVALKLDKLLLPERSQPKADFERLAIAMLSHLHGVSYAPVHGEAAAGGDGGPVQLVGLLLCVLVRKELLVHVRGVRCEVVRTGYGGVVGNKGAVALRLELHGESFCFVNVHLPSGAAPDKREQRNATLAEVLERIGASFATTAASHSAGQPAAAESPPLPPPLEHHACFVMGDLNYRLSLPNVEVRWRVWCRDWRALLQHDELSCQLRGEALAGQTGSHLGGAMEHLQEAEINFKPTYKFDVGTNAYDSSEKRRAPAWCDRVLWGGTGGTVGPLLYDACLNTVTSDHKPVKALYIYLARRRAGEPGPRDDLRLLHSWPRARGLYEAAPAAAETPWVGGAG